jgi:hypothetical protein
VIESWFSIIKKAAFNAKAQSREADNGKLNLQLCAFASWR